jgi:aminoglycoside/choline kinase family phosphotransferase
MNTKTRDSKEAVTLLYKATFGTEPASITKLPQSGSSRIYYRITHTETLRYAHGATILGAFNSNMQENLNFIRLAEFFNANGIDTPRIISTKPEFPDCYLLQDLGDTTLFSILGKLNEKETEAAVEGTMSELARLQTLPGIKDIADKCNAPFNATMVMGDLNYFKYCFLKPMGVDFDEEGLQADMEKFCDDILALPYDMFGFMYRDCQSRNVMLHDDKLYWIDFQSGRRGPCAYDAVSFLWQARAGFSMEFRETMARHYATEFSHRSGSDVESVLDAYHKLIPLRVLQTLGAYGFRGLMENKQHFIQSIPQGLKNLEAALPLLESYPALQAGCRDAIGRWHELNPSEDTSPKDTLTVRVESFSYRKGYPRETSGNGGGFIFDCRYMHNPGLYEEYKPLTGRDEPVIKFLEEQGEVQIFIRNCESTVFPAIEKYLKRGFTNLYIGFGCTGGRHRSVYSAQHLAESIHHHYPQVNVVLNHREHNIREILN